MSDTAIRRATPPDLDAVVALWCEMLEVHAEVEPLIWGMSPVAEQYGRAHLAEAIAGDNSCVLVATTSDVIVGFMVLRKEAPSPRMSTMPHGVIDDTGVARAARRRGVGKLLLDAAMDWFRTEGLRAVILGYAVNNPMSSAFWRKQGFRPYRVNAAKLIAPEPTDAAGTKVPWYQDFFDEDYMRFHVKGGAGLVEQAPLQCDFVVKALGVKPGDRVLDLCCGQGRHAVELARRGFEVSAVDLSDYLLGLARTAAAEAGVAVQFHRRDMRDLPWENRFDAVINMWTAFGYLETDEEDEKVLAAICRALRPGGRLLLHLPNRDFFRKIIADRQRTWFAHEEHLVLDEHTWDEEGRRLRLQRTIITPDGSRRYKSHDLREYTHAEIMEMLARAGLQWRRTFADFDCSEFTPESKGMLIVASKPA